jgi:hypothetical protein
MGCFGPELAGEGRGGVLDALNVKWNVLSGIPGLGPPWPLDPMSHIANLHENSSQLERRGM